MVKGINKRIVEISCGDSPYFEKAVLFLRSDAPPAPPSKIAAEAKLYAAKTEKNMFSAKPPQSKFFALLMMKYAVQLAVVISAAYVLCQYIS